eukprot:5572446-Prymnesium_polylepis.1
MGRRATSRAVRTLVRCRGDIAIAELCEACVSLICLNEPRCVWPFQPRRPAAMAAPASPPSEPLTPLTTLPALLAPTADTTLLLVASARTAITPTDWFAIFPSDVVASWSGDDPGVLSTVWGYASPTTNASHSWTGSDFPGGVYRAVLLCCDGYNLLA